MFEFGLPDVLAAPAIAAVSQLGTQLAVVALGLDLVERRAGWHAGRRTGRPDHTGPFEGRDGTRRQGVGERLPAPAHFEGRTATPAVDADQHLRSIRLLEGYILD